MVRLTEQSLCLSILTPPTLRPKLIKGCYTFICQNLQRWPRNSRRSTLKKPKCTTELLRRIAMKFRPFHDRVVIKRIEAEEKSSGGIIIPDNAREKPQEGEVIAAGPGGRDEAGKLIPIDVKVGDKVLFGKWSGTEIKLDGEDFLIMKESDIMGVLA